MRFELLKFKMDFYVFNFLNNFSIKKKKVQKNVKFLHLVLPLFIYNRTNRITIIKQFETLIKKKSTAIRAFLSVKRQLNFNSIL